MTSNIQQTEEVLHQLQESYPFSCLDSLTSTPMTGASVPYNPLSHWGSIGSVRSSPYSMAYHSRTYPLPSEELHSSTVSYHNPRTKTYEDKMEKQRLEHFLFSGGLDQQKERLRRKLNDKLNEKPTSAVEKAKPTSTSASPAVSSQSQPKKQSKEKKEKRRSRNRNAKKNKKQRRNRKKAQKAQRQRETYSASPYTEYISSSNQSPVDPVEMGSDNESDLGQLVLDNSHSMTLVDTLESEIADGDHSMERESPYNAIFERKSPSVTLAMSLETQEVDEEVDEDEERETEKPGNALNVHLLDALSAQSKEVASLKESVSVLRATVSRLEGRMHTVELMEAQQALALCARDASATGHEAVRAWMREEVGLEQYAYLLIDNGFEDMLALKTLDMQMLDSVRGIEKIGHKSRILYFVDRLKEAEDEETHEF